MAKRTDNPGGRVQGQKLPELPFQPVKDWPTNIFIDQVLAHLKASAQPETCDLLYRNKLPKNTKFRIVRKVNLDQRKRPEGDQAPCPMCQPNKFLKGALVFLPELQCCAVIGHCCADKSERAEAEREYKKRSQKDYEETLLLATLPINAKRGDVLVKLRPAAEEARRVYRKFRKEVPTIHGHLRELKSRRGGYLTVTEVMEGHLHDYGPRGLERHSDEQTREIEFGMFQGQTAVTKDYNPVKELDDLVRRQTSLPSTPSEEAAMNFIVTMTDAERRAAVAIIEGVDAYYAKFIAKLRDFCEFFRKENIELINVYGSHRLNPIHIEAKYATVRGLPRITMRHWSEKCLLLIGHQVYEHNFEWPKPIE
jgi:hypothetical protein